MEVIAGCGMWSLTDTMRLFAALPYRSAAANLDGVKLDPLELARIENRQPTWELALGYPDQGSWTVSEYLGLDLPELTIDVAAALTV